MARGVVFKQAWSINKFVNVLRDSNISAQKIALLGDTTKTVDESSIINKSFLPIATAADLYYL